MTKHTYNELEAPTNTGSIKRPARFNLRLDCSTRARTIRLFKEAKEAFNFPKDAAFADVWQDKLLLALEHLMWHMRESPTAVKTLAKSMFNPLPTEDYVRNRYAALKSRLEPSRSVTPKETAA